MVLLVVFPTRKKFKERSSEQQVVQLQDIYFKGAKRRYESILKGLKITKFDSSSAWQDTLCRSHLTCGKKSNRTSIFEFVRVAAPAMTILEIRFLWWMHKWFIGNLDRTSS